jgi:hypothetical protein
MPHTIVKHDIPALESGLVTIDPRTGQRVRAGITDDQDETPIVPAAPVDPRIAKARQKLEAEEQRILAEQAVERRRNAILDSLNQCKRELDGLPSDAALTAAIEAQIQKFANLRFLPMANLGSPLWQPAETVLDIAQLEVERRAMPLLRSKLEQHVGGLEKELAGLSK